MEKEKKTCVKEIMHFTIGEIIMGTIIISKNKKREKREKRGSQNNKKSCV